VERPFAKPQTLEGLISGPSALAFTIAPHLQTINYRRRFSRMAGI
jgi:hypothetical protein